MTRLWTTIALLAATSLLFGLGHGRWEQWTPDLAEGQVPWIGFRPTMDDVPRRWRGGSIDFKFTLLEGDLSQAYHRELALEELAKYDTERLARYVKRIFIVRTLGFSGVSAGGTVSGDTVWIAIEGTDGVPVSVGGLRTALHHEIGTLVLAAAPADGIDIDRTRWASGQSYTGDPIGAVKNGETSSSIDFELVSRGFLTSYAMTSISKDFGTVHEHLMMGPRPVHVLAMSSERLRTKVQIWERFISRTGIVAQVPRLGE